MKFIKKKTLTDLPKTKNEANNLLQKQEKTAQK